MAVVVAPALVDLGWGGWYYALACDVICAWDGAMGAGVGIGLAMALVVLGAPRDSGWGGYSASLRDGWVVRLWRLGRPGWFWWWWVWIILLRA